MMHLDVPECSLIGTNPADSTYPGATRLLPAGGSCVNFVSFPYKGPCIDAGKPQPHMLEFACTTFSLKKEEMLMVGDRLDSDVLMGNRFGVDTLLLLSGVTDVEMLNATESNLQPKYFTRSIADIVPIF